MPKPSRRGFTLIECLIAILIFAVAFLGLAGLQIKSIQLAKTGEYHLVASALLEEVAEQIMSNPPGINTAGYLGIAEVNPACLGGESSTSCDPNTLARHEHSEWLSSLASLPNGALVICRDSSPEDGTPTAPMCSGSLEGDTPLAIKIWWESSQDNGQQMKSLSLAAGV